MALFEITKNGTSAKPICDNTDLIKTIMKSTAELYASRVRASLDRILGN
jgi:hypothetical protein